MTALPRAVCQFCRRTVPVRGTGELREHRIPPARQHPGARGRYRVAVGDPLCPASGIATGEPVCRVCGCSMFRPCDEGCWWVPDPAIAVGGNVCSRCAPIINPLESLDGYVPCPTCMGTAAHLCDDRAKHDDQYGRIRAVYEPSEVYA